MISFYVIRLLLALLLLTPLLPSLACHGPRGRVLGSQVSERCEPSDDGLCLEPNLTHDTTMMGLAKDLDHLEKHIDWYGSIVAKKPDVWGEARLTSYRQETEQELSKEVAGFRVSNQGSLARTDLADVLLQLTLAAKTSVSTTSKDSTKGEKGEKGKDGKDGVNAVSDKDSIVAAALSAGSQLEPKRILDQKKLYIDHLNQLRRLNEGDDTSDAPGYSMNIVRIPVSILPGSRTDVGFGAEITHTITPIIDDELLPRTMRDLVINDLLHQWSLPILKILELKDQLYKYLDDEKLRRYLHLEVGRLKSDANPYLQGTQEHTKFFSKQFNYKQLSKQYGRPTSDEELEPTVRFSTNQNSYFSVSEITKVFGTNSRYLSFGADIKNQRPLPPVILPEVYGPGFVYEIIRYVGNSTIKDTKERSGYVHLPEVQAALKEKLIAVYRTLRTPEYEHIWYEFCNRDLLLAIRSRDQSALLRTRVRFREAVRLVSGTKQIDILDLEDENDLNRLVQFSVTAALAWGILVDAVMLNERLIEEMQRTASVSGQPLLQDCNEAQFYLPQPSSIDRERFKQYVLARWPIHVFTLDPANDEQNLEDELTTTRNTQLTLTLALLTGKLNTNAYLNAMRKTTAEYDTLALNRTQVGFMHGSDTFGWRFYPRFQTPDTRSTATVFLRDNLLGGERQNAKLRQRRLEPGLRECSAVILMPSFVNNMTIDSVSNWFPLTSPKHKVLDHTQALKLSRRVQAIRTEGLAVQDPHKYRDGDYRLLQARAEQLSQRLPFQSHRFQVPTINNLGGFELFGDSTTDLAPELYGWYGAPGLKQNGETVLFLTGDHFSINHTSVIAGNMDVKNTCTELKFKLISRQVMQVTIPTQTLALADNDEHKEPHIHIHVATPYGISRALEVPVMNMLIVPLLQGSGPLPMPRPVDDKPCEK